MANDERIRQQGQDDVARFVHLMCAQGWHTGADRLACDPIYFRERLALAHTSACDELRRLAVDLFESGLQFFALRFTLASECLPCAR
jgi:hypothetical protein